MYKVRFLTLTLVLLTSVLTWYTCVQWWRPQWRRWWRWRGRERTLSTRPAPHLYSSYQPMLHTLLYYT